MRVTGVPRTAPGAPLPVWPPLLATRGLGGLSAGHAHHAMHLVLSLEAPLRVRAGRGPWQDMPGVLTAPDVPHALDASNREVLLVFLDPESETGAALRSSITGPLRAITASERDALIRDVDPLDLMQAGGVEWTRRAVEVLGAGTSTPRPALHPRVRKVLRLLRDLSPDDDASLTTLATQVGLSPGRLMHAFTESIGLPLRPYLAWLRLQRAAAAIVSGTPLGEAAHAAGFSDAAHMTRTFRRMLGMPPSALRPPAQPVRSRR
ncbi:helix-turn-helix domain-containing protein [Hyalangium versicolor]|uniref:helix-turn-helix domain-containing protein n=1 Tax=Hyalangium versicolor TaxID=2861190 RepID=UPI001CCCB3F5|nr:AraC family transcriptional regulator [Hyalangium versicolor]